MKHRTPANNNAGETFTASINNMMREDRATCAHAAQALEIFAASGSCPAYWEARQRFANAYAARAEKRFRLTLIMIALSNLALFAALYLSRA
jgi:hypothetical protein